ncbi:MAG: undecaprenyl-diphosphate phosphatase [Treponema sp.]|uniref:undecaprenyl-diphosphate phosphatase n=1 Tax=Treponema sp. TaxID=166 RepID=UPI0025DEC3EF|nr:undecaprenyl-diphosphate phosphatase [Treponema sp.]MBQ8678805.1 undecaprenyl-diphosphate phosphatase [Treponema sp.]
MSIFQAIILGVVQGIAEFLPISSSGHLAVAQQLFGLEEVPLLFDVMLHLATLAAVVLYFRKKIARLFVILFRWIFTRGEVSPSLQTHAFSATPSPKGQSPLKSPETDLLCGTDELGRKTILAVIFATLVTGAIGVFTSKVIPDMPIKVTCAGFIVTAGLLVFSSIWAKRQETENGKLKTENEQGISIRQSLFIGFMQGIGTLPGISRSGSTIAGAQLAGVNRAAAGEFSFIVSIPAILGAFVLEAKDLGEVGSQIGLLPVLCGCLAAFAWGYLSLSLLMKLIRRGKLEWFACYLVPLGILGLIFF